jgi:hypothetical protein
LIDVGHDLAMTLNCDHSKLPTTAWLSRTYRKCSNKENRHTICFALHRRCLSCSRIGEGEVRQMEVISYDESMVVKKDSVNFRTTFITQIKCTAVLGLYC